MVKHPILGSARINERGYLRCNSGAARNKYLHRAVWELISGRSIPDGFEIHHMNGKLCFCGHNLICLPKVLNPTPPPIRHLYSGRFISSSEYERQMGEPHYLTYKTQDANLYGSREEGRNLDRA